jgi:hypothetical protein
VGGAKLADSEHGSCLSLGQARVLLVEELGGGEIQFSPLSSTSTSTKQGDDFPSCVFLTLM